MLPVVPTISFRASSPDPGPSAHVAFVDLYFHFTLKEIEVQRGDDLFKVSHMPSKTGTRDPTFGCRVVPLSSYYCVS